jgi:hypothetical protein
MLSNEATMRVGGVNENDVCIDESIQKTSVKEIQQFSNEKVR